MQITKYHLDVTLGKSKEMIYFSQLDLFYILEKALRRSQLPLYYTCGFNPHPKISFYNGLKLGQKGIIKATFYFSENISASEFQKKIHKQLPRGLRIINIKV
ncbi:MAG: TIGR03936 family radical SAM-associated protein [Candidatus Omnitrophica bacterium]|jgi:radical SAM-linked protein|nr:TIGR03936 family radical SAM-associated protein [Candidatus Omnitrophota bacterium]